MFVAPELIGYNISISSKVAILLLKSNTYCNLDEAGQLFYQLNFLNSKMTELRSQIYRVMFIVTKKSCLLKKIILAICSFYPIFDFKPVMLQVLTQIKDSKNRHYKQCSRLRRFLHNEK